MSTVTQRIEDLLAQINDLTQQTVALLASTDQKLTAKIQAADIPNMVLNYLKTGAVPVNVNNSDLDAIIAAKIALIRISTNAETLGGKSAGDFALSTDFSQLADVVADNTAKINALQSNVANLINGNNLYDMGTL